jgi:hypothetical protein
VKPRSGASGGRERPPKGQNPRLSRKDAATVTHARRKDTFDPSQAEAVLSIVAKHEARQPVTQEDWDLLFDTEPYQRLKRRETGLQRSFTDEAFQQFVLSDDLARRADELRQALDQWRSRDLQASASSRTR